MLRNKILVGVAALAFGAKDLDHPATELVQDQTRDEGCTTCMNEVFVADEGREHTVILVKAVKGKKAPAKKAPARKPAKKAPAKKVPAKKPPVKEKGPKTPRQLPGSEPEQQPPPIPPPPPLPNGSMRLSFTGNVRDLDFNILDGVEVHLYADDQLVTQTTTDEQGDFAIEVSEGQDVSWRICARNAGATSYYTCYNAVVPFRDNSERTLTYQFFIDPAFFR